MPTGEIFLVMNYEKLQIGASNWGYSDENFMPKVRSIETPKGYTVILKFQWCHLWQTSSFFCHYTLSLLGLKTILHNSKRGSSISPMFRPPQTYLQQLGRVRGAGAFIICSNQGPTGTRYPTRTRSFCRYPNPTRFFFLKIIGYFGYRVFQKILTFASI